MAWACASDGNGKCKCGSYTTDKTATAWRAVREYHLQDTNGKTVLPLLYQTNQRTARSHLTVSLASAGGTHIHKKEHHWFFPVVPKEFRNKNHTLYTLSGRVQKRNLKTVVNTSYWFKIYCTWWPLSDPMRLYGKIFYIIKSIW